MGKKLAIHGHPRRGKEVIELLEMIGGNNIHNLSGDDSYAYYVIEGCQNEIRKGEYIFGDEDMYFFTLEEFLEKYPFKVGDEVVDRYGDSLTIKSMSWSADCETIVYDFKDSVLVLAAADIVKLIDDKCERTHEDAIFDSIIWHLRNSVNNGKQNLSGGECEDYFREVVKKNKENKMKGVLAELLEHIKTTPKEDLEREFEEIKEWSDVGPTVEEFRAFCECVNKKPEYPDNYEECVRIAKNIHGYDIHVDVPAYGELMESFVKLLICRDAYWKIAGEEMGLGKPWEPNWTTIEGMPAIFRFRYNIVCEYIMNYHCSLVFPTEEIRDVFYKNFNDLIEQCKELL